MKTKAFFILFLVAASVQSFAGELGKYRGQSTTANSAQEAKSESYQWIHNTCQKIERPRNKQIQSYEEAVHACPKLKDYTAVQKNYEQWLKEAQQALTPIPPHAAAGSICKTEHSWFDAATKGKSGTKCKVYLPDNTYLDGNRI
jgi:hypothetical protein